MTREQFRIASDHFGAIVEATDTYAPKDGSELNAWFPYLLMGIISRESHWGLALDDEWKGDNKHGHGLGQIDDRSHGEWLRDNDWKDGRTNILYAAKLLRGNHRYFVGKGLEGHVLTRAAISAYNRGPGNIWRDLKRGLGPDEKTTGGDYSADVWQRANWFHQALSREMNHPFRPRPAKMQPKPVETLDVDLDVPTKL